MSDKTGPSGFDRFAQEFAAVPPSYNKQPQRDLLTSATGKLTVNGKGWVSFGSGFNIGGNCFLTAGHCCDLLRDSHDAYIQFEKGQHPTYQYRINKIILHINSEGMDFGILLLGQNDEPVVNLCLDDPNVHLGNGVRIAHYPGGNPMVTSQGTIQRMDTGALGGDVAEVAKLDTYEKAWCFRYTAGTNSGSSGAPVALMTDGSVLGVHVKGDDQTQTVHAATSLKFIDAMCQNKLGRNLRELVNKSPGHRSYGAVVHTSKP